MREMLISIRFFLRFYDKKLRFGMLDEFRIGPRGNVFKNKYRCYSSSFGALSETKSNDIQKGGKVILPPSALDQLSRLNISYPMLFKLTNSNKTNRSTHCGVLEFVAEEGIMFLPYWMMQNLLLAEGDLVLIENCTLPVATYAKFKPQSTEFLDISDPKAVLENALRNFACLTKGDVIAIQYNNRQYELYVLEVRPQDAVCIIECDISLEFDAPVGYQKQEVDSAPEQTTFGTPDVKKAIEDYMKENAEFSAFEGTGFRLDGRKKNTKSKKNEFDPSQVKRGIPNYKWKVGSITYNRNNTKPKVEEDDPSNNFSAFKGKGQALRKKRT
uniref:Ubiquitin recognition factor in ER-associated degradation protein 1 n=1 Tax=Phallusia mammillata TaxID=59560 RepID=A0A6F9DWV9_9ASCI|nr:ubiquitin fusion degradation protein 1 homolog [Phallusia mammillata]